MHLHQRNNNAVDITSNNANIIQKQIAPHNYSNDNNGENSAALATVEGGNVTSIRELSIIQIMH